MKKKEQYLMMVAAGGFGRRRVMNDCTCYVWQPPVWRCRDVARFHAEMGCIEAIEGVSRQTLIKTFET